MSIKHNEFIFPSSSGLGDIFAQSFELNNTSETKGVFQLVHSIAEHSDRYKEFAVFLCSRGYAVFTHDHIGHGRSVLSDEAKGSFAYFQSIQERIVKFVADNSNMPADRFRELMLTSGELVMDVGTILNGEQAVNEGLIDSLGSLSTALAELYNMIEEQKAQEAKEESKPEENSDENKEAQKSEANPKQE